MAPNLIKTDILTEYEFTFLFLPKNNQVVHRYFIEMAYNGTRFHGWQVQPNAMTVQECIESALSTLLREKIEVTGAGRTDAGVHSSYFVAHFDSENSFAGNPDLVHKLNSFLKNDLVIFSINLVGDEAHARFDAISRTYQYHINLWKDPFATDFSWHFYRPLNIQRMNEACKILFEFSDFTSFSKLHTDVKTNNCRIMKAEWQQVGNGLIFTVKADRFLRNMVRALVGTLLEVGLGKMDVNGFCRVIEQKDRGAAGFSVPAHGLFLTDVEYPESVFIKRCQSASYLPVK